MAALAVLAPQSSLPSMMVQSFKGDQEILVDRLIAASQRKEVSFESLQDRPLVPFFDSSEASAASFQALQPGRRGTPSRPVPVPAAKAGRGHQQGLKRADRSCGALASSPPKKENEVLQAKHQRRAKAAPTASGGSAASSGSASDTEMTSPPPQPPRGKKAGGRKAGKAAGGASPPRKASMDMAALAAASVAASAALRTPGGGRAAAPRAPAPYKFAGPAFTNSPTPDCLPIPTSSLLLQDAADTLRSRLNL